MRQWTLAAPAVLLAAGGCLASKGDVALLQQELEVQRAQMTADSLAVARAEDARRAQISGVASEIQRANDTLRVVLARLASFESTSLTNYDQMHRELVQIQALTGQATANVQRTQQQLEALREQGLASMSAAPPAAAATPDSSQKAVPPGTPGPATLFLSGREQLTQGAYGIARQAFQTLLDTYPTYDADPSAQLFIGEAFAAEGNNAAADSVYRVVVAKYPKSDEAATALYKRGSALLAAGKRAEATRILQQVQRDYPGSDAADLAKTLLKKP